MPNHFVKIAVASVCLTFCILSPELSSAGPEMPKKRIAFTFDDVPRGDSAIMTAHERSEYLISELKRAGIEGAMFFAVGSMIEQRDPGHQRLTALIAAGHSIANHSYTHSALSDGSAADYLADIDQAQTVLENATDPAPYFRFPYLNEGRSAEKRDAVREGLTERGLKNGYVTIDNYDWYIDSKVNEAVKAGKDVDFGNVEDLYLATLLDTIEFYDAIAVEALDRSPAHIILLHENDLAAMYVADLAYELKRKGWEIISAEEAYKDPISDYEPDTLFLGQGRVAAIAHERGLRPARELIHQAEDEDWLDAEFERLEIISEPHEADYQ
jgi:peptidoglycan/xylan/chitin deacetylase (PgdA/CDA1 family)